LNKQGLAKLLLDQIGNSKKYFLEFGIFNKISRQLFMMKYSVSVLDDINL